MLAGAEVHLVGRLSAKRRVWKLRVVLLDVERDELSQCRKVAQRVHEQPLVLESAPNSPLPHRRAKLVAEPAAKRAQQPRQESLLCSRGRVSPRLSTRESCAKSCRSPRASMLAFHRVGELESCRRAVPVWFRRTNADFRF